MENITVKCFHLERDKMIVKKMDGIYLTLYIYTSTCYTKDTTANFRDDFTTSTNKTETGKIRSKYTVKKNHDG